MKILNNWNWTQKKWPNFTYNEAKIRPLEDKYTKIAGEFRGVLKYISLSQKNQLTLYLLSQEALETSSIEGEILDRKSVQSSLQRHLGLKPTSSKTKPQESGMANLMMHNFQNFDQQCSKSLLNYWNKLIHQGHSDSSRFGKYRTSSAPMQIISGAYGHEKIHFQAPPSDKLELEMKEFIRWFNYTGSSLSPLIRASIAHLYFVSIHPYEDGNGRISRALVEKVLSQYQGVPALTNISRIILQNRKKYYLALENSNRNLEITDWIYYLGKTIIKAQEYALSKVENTILKTKLYDRYQSDLNQRQIKVLEKLFEAQPEGFEGGLSAENYLSITQTSRATATRDLQKLVELEILKTKGERRYRRYYLYHKLSN